MHILQIYINVFMKIYTDPKSLTQILSLVPLYIVASRTAMPVVSQLPQYFSLKILVTTTRNFFVRFQVAAEKFTLNRKKTLATNLLMQRK